MQPMPSGQGFSRIQDLQRRVSVLRRSVDPVSGHSRYIPAGVQPAPQGDAVGVDGAGAQRAGDTQTGEGAALYWPGRGHGVRAPGEFETPLSWGEVMHGIRAGLIGGVV